MDVYHEGIRLPLCVPLKKNTKKYELGAPSTHKNQHTHRNLETTLEPTRARAHLETTRWPAAAWKKVSQNTKIDTDIRRYLTHVERDLGIDIRKYIYILFFTWEGAAVSHRRWKSCVTAPAAAITRKPNEENMLASSAIARFLQQPQISFEKKKSLKTDWAPPRDSTTASVN